MAMNKYPLWKNVMIAVVVLLGTLYSLPNMFGEDYAIQISNKQGFDLTESQLTDIKQQVSNLLKEKSIEYKSIEDQKTGVLVRMRDPEEQLLARTWIKSKLDDDYIVALNLAPATPRWLSAIGAEPMKLGLDLRGGVHFLMEVDTSATIGRYLDTDLEEMRKSLRDQKIRYRGVAARTNPQTEEKDLLIKFRSADDLKSGREVLQKNFPHLIFANSEKSHNEDWNLTAKFSEPERIRIRNYAMDQSLATLRKRVNELGVAEAIVQRQGVNRIVVELPGIQDTARAKDIIGKTATVEFRLAYPENLSANAVAPAGYNFFNMQDNRRDKVALKQDVILTGESIIGAYADLDTQSNRPSVAITLGGSSGPITKFSQTTLENQGKPLASVYVETKFKEIPQPDGSVKTVKEVTKDVISVATIQSALGKRFQITGLTSMQEAKNLALLLRAGALPAPVHIVSERTIGPSLGKENINMGLNSVLLGLGLVLVFMMMYYRVFGIIADIALIMNLVILVAICSLIHVTMTLPGIAGIVLTLGMAVDANVLIFERIREEIRHNLPYQAAIKAGYEKAFATIVDANITTLIAAVVLFGIGSGPVKGFAVVLIIGLLTSMFTAITGSRALVNWWFGEKRLQSLPIGI